MRSYRIVFVLLISVSLTACQALTPGATPTATGVPQVLLPTATPLPIAPASPTVVPDPTGQPTVAPTASPSVASPIDVPAAGAKVMLPLHVLAHVGKPGEQIDATLVWQDGTTLEHTFKTLSDGSGRGLVIGSFDWMMESQPPQPPTQPATLELHDKSGKLLASQTVTLVGATDPLTTQIKLYFVGGQDLYAVTARVPKTYQIGAATLEELLWGPPPANLAGFETAIPTPEQVLNYAGRQPDWGPRVKLKTLTLVNGVATADFSKEMEAYGGGSLRVSLLRKQITETLKQFSTISEVRIAVEGQTEDVLQP